MDAGLDAAAVEPCARAADCDDGLYCNGTERCEPGAASADALGCVSGTPPCDATTETCDEATDACTVDDCADGGDGDGDGDPRIACGGGDCDDENAAIYSTAQEICDDVGVDEDCNPETIRDASAGSTDGDEDMDGFVSDDCFNLRPDSTENRGTDCDDTRAGVNPGESDVCGGGDQDCDGSVDEEPSILYYFDMDGDGYGVNVSDSNVLACSPPSASYTLLEGDCDETRPGVHPGVPDSCNGLDDDCDGSADPGCACTDGTSQTCGPSTTTGDCAQSTRVCTAGAWPMACPGAVYPGTEVCGGGDEDCDGTTDESGASDAMLFYRDSDRDGYGDPASPMRVCATRVGGLPDPYVPNSRDCNDGDDGISPTAVESCDGVDENCNGMVDDVPGGCVCTNGTTRPCGPPEAGTGNCRNGTQTCTSGRWGTCDGAVVPGTETCGGGDEDCDGSTDESGAVGELLFYRDADGDGYGSISMTRLACAAPTGYVADNTDCIDADANAHPGQRTYYAEPACLSGSPHYGYPIPGMGYSDRWYCDFTLATEADWDYDCTGYVSVGPDWGATCGVSCTGTAGLYNPFFANDPSDCGQVVTNWKRCELSGSSCGGTMFSDTARCR
ncbi:MAG: putative metal-binding motif-containing protein [Myxococcales bacterium]|nr:putative metal-binding motif-containing protein [Myxococcales bacterium]